MVYEKKDKTPFCGKYNRDYAEYLKMKYTSLLPKYIKFIFRDIFPSVFAHVNAGL
jgi:hypothetical protein